MDCPTFLSPSTAMRRPSLFMYFLILVSEIVGGLSLSAREPKYPGKSIEQTLTGQSTVRAPAGTNLRQNAHFVPEGGQVITSRKDGLIQLLASNGSVLHTTPMSQGKKTNNPITLSTYDQPVLSPRALGTAYGAFAYFNNSAPTASPISSFSTSWNVPPNPSTWDGQLLYIFSAVVPSTLDSVLLSVLQYGNSTAGGGNYSTVGSWYIVGNDVYYTSLTQVKPGQAVTSSLGLRNTLQEESGNKSFSWSAEFTGMPASTLSIISEAEFVYAYEALEFFDVSGVSDLFANASKTELRDITILNQDGLLPIVNWTIGVDAADGFGMNVVPLAGSTPAGNGNSGGLDIIYPLE